MKRNDRSDEVKLWKEFLIGRGNYWLVTDGPDSNLFDDFTEEATKQFQHAMYLKDDGIVGTATLRSAKILGFEGKLPDIIKTPLSYSEREKIFGKFKYTPAPTPFNPEAITIEEGWIEDNIDDIVVPLSKSNFKIKCHKKVKNQFINCFNEWEDAGLSQRIISFDGSFVPRFVRGSRQYLSNHSWGTAFDINASFNRLGAAPSKAGIYGSVGELIPIAEKNGFFWGGNFSRIDGMHFEIARIL